ncbi:GntR family transcriptional regulator [Novosphingobium resinovorum]|uniref:GntR family transcriptional regulator n=1 Tax=Novosphingobium resinovorum TaxID=158500 RepID=A0A1D8ABM7_9SPHN|nr:MULTISPECIES: GntR family transcriptional regulator [Novosphingobium]AOR79496.1 GntR family transcriptional regulator [Novosphingobium resinovorum]MBF7013582.1 GntR family transcriptional regulator [Novosphingobium sp. HR1a]WJM25732.1 GntR family transcriptional regulator [Novosphingobium resinovorum]
MFGSIGVVDRDAAVPLYYQIYLQLRDEILSGQRPFGSAMPTEHELAELFGVSRITARRVLNELAEQRYVERKRRLGTTVIFKSPAKPIEADIDQAMDSLMALGSGTTVNVIEVNREKPNPTVAAALQVDAGEDVIRAVRIRYLDGTPIGYVVSYVPGDLAGLITPGNLGKGPILQLLADAGYKAVHADQTIGALQADPKLAQALEIAPLAALLRISRTSYDANERPFLLTFAHYRSDKFTIRLDLHGTRYAVN